jgi:hypothetical protein
MYSPSSIITVFIIFPIIGLIVLALRFFVRLRVQKPPELWIDDWLIFVGAILTVALNVNGLIGRSTSEWSFHTFHPSDHSCSYHRRWAGKAYSHQLQWQADTRPSIENDVTRK